MRTEVGCHVWKGRSYDCVVQGLKCEGTKEAEDDCPAILPSSLLGRCFLWGEICLSLLPLQVLLYDVFKDNTHGSH